MTTQHGSFLATRRGGLTLLLLCAVQFLRGYLVTYGGSCMPLDRLNVRIHAANDPRPASGTGPWRRP